MKNKKSLKNIDVKGKKVFMRVDFNVPVIANKVADDTRIVSALKSIEYLLNGGARLAIVSHRGRPKGEWLEDYSMKVCATHLESLLGKKVDFVDDVVGDKVIKKLEKMSDGEVIMLENVRFYEDEESEDDQKRLDFAKKLTEGFDIVVNDAFGVCHRKNTSSYDVGLIKEVIMGFLIEKELKYLSDTLLNPSHPFVSIMGGAKVSDKLKVIEVLLPIVDKMIIGGAMAYTFYKSMGYEVGTSLVDDDLVEYCATLLDKYKDKIMLPVDVVVAKEFDFANMKSITPLREIKVTEFENDDMGLDIGSNTIKLFSETLKSVKTVFWNGPMGVFESNETNKGTYAIAYLLSEITKDGAITIIGGGDSAFAVKKSGHEKDVTHISTGGGASLEFLTQEELPGVSVLANV